MERRNFFTSIFGIGLAAKQLTPSEIKTVKIGTEIKKLPTTENIKFNNIPCSFGVYTYGPDIKLNLRKLE